MFDVPVYVYDKLDGSHIRAEWSNYKKRFVKFGRKAGLLDDNFPLLKKAWPLIKKKYEADFNKIFRKESFYRVVGFFEFFGKKSFAGFHQEDDEFDVVLFDVNPYKKGIWDPRYFEECFRDKVEIPNLLYKGKINKTFISSVKDGTLSGVSFEGVVCKTLHNSPKMFKIKSNAWISKLREHYDEKTFKELY